MKIISTGKEIRITCKLCGTVIEVEKNDVKFNEMGHSYLAGVPCPACNTLIEVSSMIPNSWYPEGF